MSSNIDFGQWVLSNDAGRVKRVLILFYLMESLVFLFERTRAIARARCFAGRVISRRRPLIRVHPTRSARVKFINPVLPTNHLFDHSGP